MTTGVDALFHKAKLTMLGTTKEYVGCPELNYHNTRFEQAPKKYQQGAPKVARKPYHPPGRQAPEQVTEHCKSYKLNQAFKLDREKAVEWFKKDQRKEWSKTQLSRQDLPADAEESEPDDDPPPEIPDAIRDSEDIKSFIDHFNYSMLAIEVNTKLVIRK
ncbi:hypothetical protein PtA15_17A362 [Puccinia triticina]|uniref:Uncharacterized protein n=1 Tax=Puccinia triticina TaxID=208348 RepID=A0ABY7D7L4_9BASI|nr:uncharacterized protein PtA15_17A362 [Puccinia triticina]WAQ92880.1 hypothetical protein PtA15_17A362 [Puccinia triticina]